MWVALKRAGCCVAAFGGYVNCACVPQLFPQLINTMLCPAFLQEIHLSTSLLCTSLNTNFLSKSCFGRWIPCCLLTHTAMKCAVTNFGCHKLITIVHKKKTVTWKILLAIGMEKDFIFWTPKISTFVCVFFHICWISAKNDFLFPKVV